jgi:hypothetical protein
MADQHIDVEKLPVEESQFRHTFYYGDIEGWVAGTDYKQCLEDAKDVLKWQKDIDADKSDISIPDFE